MLLIALDKRDPLPAYRQIAHKIQRLIETDVIGAGEILPPTRRLARQLNVSRYTVTCAYQELWARGYLESTPGSYSRVRKRTERRGSAAGPSEHAGAPAKIIDLASYRLDQRLFPMRDLRRALHGASRDQNAALLHSADPQGYLPLRETIAARLRSHSIPAEPDSVLITNGAVHGLDLCFRLLAGEGGRIIVEEPTFQTVLALARQHGVTPVGVPLREDGVDVSVLKKRLGQRGLRFLFTIPTYHNPTGITASRECREGVLSLCAGRGLPIVEDSFEEEMSYFGGVILPLMSMDRSDGVLYLGTFSKVLFPGLRLGWVAADPSRIRRLTEIRASSDDGGSAMIMAAMNELCVSGSYQKHLDLVNRTGATRMHAALAALSRHVPPDKATWTRPNGGFLIWLTLHGAATTEKELHERLLSHGVDLKPGSAFFSSAPKRLHLRLCISAHEEEVLVEAIRRLGKALEELG